MRICQVIEACGAGSGKAALDLIDYLLSKGHEVTLVYSDIRAEQGFLDAIAKMPRLKIISLPMQRSVSFLDAISVIKLVRLIQREGPFDLIHSHSSKAGAIARIAALFAGRSKSVYTPHAFITLDQMAHPIYRLLEWALSFLCDGVIAVSKYESDHAVNHLGISRRRVYTIPNGTTLNYNASRDSARSILGATSEEEFIVGYVGRFAKQKRPDRAIRSFAALTPIYKSLRLVMVGYGPLLDSTRKLAHEEGVSDRVAFFEGYNAQDLMPGFDALLCSSDYEGFALIFLEALSAGVPIVTTNVGGAIESIPDGGHGYVARSFSDEDLSGELLKVVGLSCADHERESLLAKEHAKNFSIEIMCGKTERLYFEICGLELETLPDKQLPC